MVENDLMSLEVSRCCRRNEDYCRCWYSSLLLASYVVVLHLVVVASDPADDLLCIALARREEDLLTRPWRTRVSVPSKFLMDFSIATMESISSCSSAMTTDRACSSMFTFGWVVLWC